jgi:uncharacterized C2H2 Zn-finger protein
MKRIKCPQCGRVFEIEASYMAKSATGEAVLVQRAHSTCSGSEIQCACGKLL